MEQAPPIVAGKYEYSATDKSPEERPLPLSVSVVLLGAASLACWAVIVYLINII